MGLEEASTTYRWVQAEEARKILLLQGEARFGPPDAETVAAINALRSRDHLEELAVQLLRVSSWRELLATPRSPRRSRRRE